MGTTLAVTAFSEGTIQHDIQLLSSKGSSIQVETAQSFPNPLIKEHA